MSATILVSTVSCPMGTNPKVLVAVRFHNVPHQPVHMWVPECGIQSPGIMDPWVPVAVAQIATRSHRPSTPLAASSASTQLRLRLRCASWPGDADDSVTPWHQLSDRPLAFLR